MSHCRRALRQQSTNIVTVAERDVGGVLRSVGRVGAVLLEADAGPKADRSLAKLLCPRVVPVPVVVPVKVAVLHVHGGLVDAGSRPRLLPAGVI